MPDFSSDVIERLSPKWTFIKNALEKDASEYDFYNLLCYLRSSFSWKFSFHRSMDKTLFRYRPNNDTCPIVFYMSYTSYFFFLQIIPLYRRGLLPDIIPSSSAEQEVRWICEGSWITHFHVTFEITFCFGHWPDDCFISNVKKSLKGHWHILVAIYFRETPSKRFLASNEELFCIYNKALKKLMSFCRPRSKVRLKPSVM